MTIPLKELQALRSRAFDNSQHDKLPKTQVPSDFAIELIDAYIVMHYSGKSSEQKQQSKGLPDLDAQRSRLFKDEITVGDIATAVLRSGWDYRDLRDRMTKTPDEVEDFLDSIKSDQYKWSDFDRQQNPSARFLRLAIEAYQYAYRHQY